MKKIIATIAITMGLISGAYAHHNSGSDNAGKNMSDNSGHLTVFGPLAHHNAGSDSAGGNISDGSGHLDLFIG